jgi:hypothetical protein
MASEEILIKVIYHLELDLGMGEVVAGLFLQSNYDKIGVTKWYMVGPMLNLIVDNPPLFQEFVTSNPEWATAQSVTRIKGGAS